MRTIILCAVASSFCAIASRNALADAPPASMLMHVELVEGKQATDHAVYVSDGGGEMTVDQPGGGKTAVKVRLTARGAVVQFEVARSAVDHASYAVKGEVALPAPGRRVVVARVPRTGGGEAEVVLSVSPPK